MKIAASVVVVTLIACSQLVGGGGQEKEKKASAQHAPCRCPQAAVITRVTDERDECRNELERHADATEALAPRVIKRAVIKEGPAKQCGGSGPNILPVESQKAPDGKLFLDEKAQVALAANLASYEKWVRKVQECERDVAPAHK